ncbi:MAG: S8 family serine peptidase [Actinobacteria bacterium]|nr:S8 family serine peptidase [Actinomycetota bacterium]
MLRGLAALAFASLALVASAAGARPDPGSEPLVEVVVGLSQRPLGTTRWLAGRGLQARTLAATQRLVEQRIGSALPEARIRWRYRVVANGLAVVVPRSQVARLAAVLGVARIYPSVRYTRLLDRSPQQIGAPALWQPGLANAGEGIKIGIIDEGIDQTHPFFDPQGYTMPAGYPKGQRAYTTAKVIVARAFPPARPTWKHASKPFDPDLSSHGTHVAGIAAGNADTLAAGARISGVAPRAYLGNYKALTIPTDADVGLDGNSPELVAAIEAAVNDDMDVINLSLGEPEIEPSRDIVSEALAAAARAGVVPVVAAGNDFADFGRGSLSSPGSTPAAITVGAVTTNRSGPPGVIAGFSSSGPTPLSLQLKPEVSAPGVNILSASPGGDYVTLSGTSMAAPHVAGAVALLRQRHPAWTPAQLKSALALTGDRAFSGDARTVEASTVREGGGVVNLPRANDPLVFAAPVALSFGLVAQTATLAQTVVLTDAGGGLGDWSVTLEQQTAAASTTIGVPPTVPVPGSLTVTVATAGAPEAEVSGFVVLTRGAERRRIPYWFRVSAPALAGAKPGRLARPGLYRATTRGGTSLVSRYRYPESPERLGFATDLSGPERVFRVRLDRPTANFGVVVVSTAQGVRVEPRIVRAGDENRLTGYPALPFNLNPYLRTFREPVPVSGAILPGRGDYDVVFDTPSDAQPGAFTFRFWLADTRPPTLELRTRTVKRGTPVIVRATDAGSGVDPSSRIVRVDGTEREVRVAGERILIGTPGLQRGRHTLFVQVSDYQESRNMENVGPILPNTRILRIRFTVR